MFLGWVDKAHLRVAPTHIPPEVAAITAHSLAQHPPRHGPREDGGDTSNNNSGEDDDGQTACSQRPVE